MIFVPELVLLYQQIRDGTLEIKISSIVFYALGAAVVFLFFAHGAGVLLTPLWVKLLVIIPFAVMSGTLRHQFFAWVRSPACPSWYRWYVWLVRAVTCVLCLTAVCIIIWAVASGKPH